ncbi:MAG: hypothetical protein ACPGYV_03685 [Phycisphaeraceae bacterium]
MRRLISSNSLRIAVLVWFSGWLLLVMPGHKRGIVELPGGEADAVASCCEPRPSCCDDASVAVLVGDACTSDTVACDGDGSFCCDDTPRPTDPAKHCAICYLKSHLTDPPAVVLYTPYLGELDELVFVTLDSIIDALATPDRLRGRAPPA